MTILYVSVAAHGFGHAAQTAPVVNALRARRPELRLVIRSALPRARLAAHFAGAFEHGPEPAEIGMCMDNALDVDAQASYAAHLAFHRDWAARVEREAAALRACGADLVVANASYLMLAAAAAADIPAVLLGSLNWADIFLPYCAAWPEAGRLHAEMLAAYNRARMCIQLEPHMPMPDLQHRCSVGPVARVGKERRAEIAARLGLAPGARLVLVSPGGIDMPLALEAWPVVPGVRFVFVGPVPEGRSDLVSLAALQQPYIDVLRASDAVITKPGYGTFAECACNGIPVLYVPRHDWPEEPYLVNWLHRVGRCAELPREALASGVPESALHALWAQPAPPPRAPSGVVAAADCLEGLLVEIPRN